MSNNLGFGNGLLVIVSSPSGGGKTSVIHEVRRRNSKYGYSISATTRPRRESEIDGSDYYFITDKQFDEYIEKKSFVEWANVHGFRYGTLKETIEKQLNDDKIVLLDIDVIGGMNVKKQFPDNSFLIFLYPPSKQELVQRLEKRNSDSKEDIERRIGRLPMEMSHVDKYDVKIINYKLDETVQLVEQEIKKYQSKLEV